MSILGDELARAIAELDESKVFEAADRINADPAEREALLESIQHGIAQVVQRYEAGEYFIADIIMAGALYSEVLSRVAVLGNSTRERGRVVCGVVSRDIHEFGKNVIAGILEYNGYDVIDLGADVDPAVFASAVRDYKPDALILSGVLDLSLVQMERTISALEEMGLRGDVRVLLGGSCVTREQCEAIGGDGYIENLLDCLSLCERGAQ